MQASGDIADQDTNVWSPKLGLEWRPTTKLRLRAAAFRSLKQPVLETIEPTQIAGFDQLSGNFTGTRVDEVAIGADYRLSGNLTLGVEAIHRNVTPTFLTVDETGDVDAVLGRQVDREYRAFIYWTPTDRIAFSTDVERSEFFQPQKEAVDSPTEINTWLVPVQLGWFSPSGLFAMGRTTLLDQVVEHDNRFLDRPREHNLAFVADAVVGYRFPGRRGFVSLEINNILDESFHYQSDAFRSADVQDREARISPLPRPLFLPERTVLLRIGVNF